MEPLLDNHAMLLEFGIGGILVVQVLRIVLIDFLGKGQGTSSKRPGWVNELTARLDGLNVELQVLDKRLAVIEVMDKDLHAWHAPNEEGEQNWKNTKMLKLLDKIEHTIALNTKVIEKICTNKK